MIRTILIATIYLARYSIHFLMKLYTVVIFVSCCVDKETDIYRLNNLPKFAYLKFEHLTFKHSSP